VTRGIGRLAGFAFALALVLLAASALGPSAHADGPNAVFHGFVVPDPTGAPTRVRAVSANGTVCGTADVQPSGVGVGFYTLSVVTGATKAGCPPAGGELRFTLVYGLIDESLPAVTSAVLTPGTVTVLNLYAARAGTQIGGFEGTPPEPGSYAVMRWTGPARTPTEQALATLGFSVTALYHYNGVAGRYEAFVPGAPDWASAFTTVGAGDDVIIVRAP
jgi:hypothetical protein